MRNGATVPRYETSVKGLSATRALGFRSCGKLPDKRRGGRSALRPAPRSGRFTCARASAPRRPGRWSSTCRACRRRGSPQGAASVSATGRRIVASSSLDRRRGGQGLTPEEVIERKRAGGRKGGAAQRGKRGPDSRPVKMTVGELPFFEPDPRWNGARIEAFLHYRNLAPGERSIAAVAERFYPDKPGKRHAMSQWSNADEWPARARAWDMKVDHELQEAFLAETRNRAREMARDAAELQAGLMAPARELTKRLEQAARDGRDPWTGEQIDLRELIAMTTAASRAIPGVANLERLSRGMSTSNVDVHDSREMARRKAAGMGADELRRQLAGIDDGAEGLAPEVIDVEVVESS